MPSPQAERVTAEQNLNRREAGVTFEFPNVEKIDLLLTFRCNAACAHCITGSHPRRHESLEEAEIRELLTVGGAYGKRYTGLTGGEPFLDFPLLLRVIGAAKALGYTVCSDTNAFWGVTEERAANWVGRLVDAGLDGLFPSADSYHLPFVSIDRVRRVVEACDAAGLPCEVNFLPGPDPSVDEEILAALDLGGRGYYCDGIQTTGNDVSDFLSLFPRLAPSEIDDLGSMHLGISPRGDAYANVDISDSGREYAGTPLALGNIRADGVETVFAAERERPLLAIARERRPSEVHVRLASDPELGAAYAATAGSGRYYSASAYWIELFRSELGDAFAARLDRWALGGWEVA